MRRFPRSNFAAGNSLLSSLPGRLFLLASAISIPLFILTRFAQVELPPLAEVFRKVSALAWFVSLAWLAVLAFARNRKRFLWRVRQKLILSYVFLGFVPVLLLGALLLVAALVLYLNVSSYMFHEAFEDISRDVLQAAETTSAEIGRTPAAAEAVLTRKYENLSARYPALSLALVRLEQSTGKPTVLGVASPPPIASAGPWRHLDKPPAPPQWLPGAGAFQWVVAVPADGAPEESVLVMRALVVTRSGDRAVIADLPVDASVAVEIESRTKVRIGQVHAPAECGGAASASNQTTPGGSGFFRQTVAFVQCKGWLTGSVGAATVSLDAPIRRLYAHVTDRQVGGASYDQAFFFLLIFLAVLFLIIQGSALLMGALLARSITFAVHELFIGTERVRLGDFSHRININSGDQLGDLALSFNRMSSGMEHLLHVQREKQRLDDELRIAREIQKSLLPTSLPGIDGLSIADLCEPAREVGGDYYDFFDLGHRRIGVMVADVSGKGTSAALYMAELKGLMLALSRKEHSPRRLLIEANRLLSDHLDNRSFITMTYAVIDLDARTLVCARAGHTPLIIAGGEKSDVITPSGLVLGLRLPGAAERFEQILEEYTRSLKDRDVIVLYTDGITEAMDAEGNLFSDEALAAIVQGQQHLDAAGIRERIVRDVRSFVGDAEPHDDMTMIVMKVGA